MAPRIRCVPPFAAICHLVSPALLYGMAVTRYDLTPLTAGEMDYWKCPGPKLRLMPHAVSIGDPVFHPASAMGIMSTAMRLHPFDD